MRAVKKIGGVIIALCLLMPCFSMVVNAADGKISFSDPSTKVGDMVEVKCAVRSTGGSLGNVEVGLSYDSEYLSFESGDGAEAGGDGALTLAGNGGSSEQVFMITFQALKEGSTQITISGATIASAGGNELTLDQGNSTVKIAEGDPSKIKEKKDDGGSSSSSAEDMQVEVNGTAYMLTDKFSDGDIPTGYTRTTVSLDGQERQMVVNENSGVTLGYLTNGDSGSFFLYLEDNATFVPYEELAISDKTSIILLSDTSEVNLPEEYQQADLTLEDKTFPVWQKADDEGYYILYALNSSGVKDYYRYDAEENTYQRFEPEAGEEEEKKTGGLLGKVEQFISDNIQKIVLFGGLGLIVIILLIFILSIKLFNRNKELDELYEEYGLNDMPEPEPVKKKKDKKKSSPGPGRGRQKDYDIEDDFATSSMDFTEDMGFTEDMSFTEDMGFTEDMSFTEDMGFTEDMDFTENMGFTGDMDFTEDMSFGEEDFATEELGFDESGFDTAQLDYEDGDLLDDVDKDEFVVYGGESRTEELTIDDLDALLNEEPKNAKRSNPDDTFKVDFIDLD